MSTPKPFTQLTEVKDTAEVMASFLEAEALGRLCQTSKKSQILFSKQLTEMSLLKAVFDADRKRVKEILEKPKPKNSKCLVLSRTSAKESYFSQKLRRKICKREWRNISPLEAAVWCGDIYIVCELLSHLPKTEREKAAKQVRSLLIDQSKHGGFLAPYKALIEAYNAKIEKFDTEAAIIRISNIYLSPVWPSMAEIQDERDKLWNDVFEKQKLLPTYGLQEYCGGGRTKVHPTVILPKFIKEPKRDLVMNGEPLDLGAVPYGYGLWMSPFRMIGDGSDGQPGFDRKIIQNFIEQRTKDVFNIIKILTKEMPMEPKNAQDFLWLLESLRNPDFLPSQLQKKQNQEASESASQSVEQKPQPMEEEKSSPKPRG